MNNETHYKSLLCNSATNVDNKGDTITSWEAISESLANNTYRLQLSRHFVQVQDASSYPRR